MGGEVSAHLLRVVDDEGDVAEMVAGSGRGFVEKLDVLVVVDFDEGYTGGSIGLLEVVGFGIT